MNEYIVVKDIHLPLTDNSLEDVVIKKGEVWKETGEEPAAWNTRKCCIVLRRLSDGHESVFNKALIGEYLKTADGVCEKCPYFCECDFIKEEVEWMENRYKNE